MDDLNKLEKARQYAAFFEKSDFFDLWGDVRDSLESLSLRARI